MSVKMQRAEYILNDRVLPGLDTNSSSSFGASCFLVMRLPPFFPFPILLLILDCSCFDYYNANKQKKFETSNIKAVLFCIVYYLHYLCNRLCTNFHNDKQDIDNRSQRFYWQFHRRRSTKQRYGSVGCGETYEF